jgi:hypothetical protein
MRMELDELPSGLVLECSCLQRTVQVIEAFLSSSNEDSTFGIDVLTLIPPACGLLLRLLLFFDIN